MMTSRDFAYWLQGKFEPQPPEVFNNEELECIKEHARIVISPDGLVTGTLSVIEMYEVFVKEMGNQEIINMVLVDFIKRKLDEYFTKITSPLTTTPYPHGDGIINPGPYVQPPQIVVGDPPLNLAPTVWCSPGGSVSHQDNIATGDSLSHLDVRASC